MIGPNPAIIFVDPDTGEDCPVEEFEVFEESFDERAMIEEGGAAPPLAEPGPAYKVA